MTNPEGKKSISTPKIDFPFEFPNFHKMDPTHQVPFKTTSKAQLFDKLNPYKDHNLDTSKPPPNKIPIKVMRRKDVHTLWNYFKHKPQERPIYQLSIMYYTYIQLAERRGEANNSVNKYYKWLQILGKDQNFTYKIQLGF